MLFRSESGFDNLFTLSLPTYRKYFKTFSQNDSGVFTLLHLISEIWDTNVYKRGGLEGVLWLQNKAYEIAQDVDKSLASILSLDKECIEKNLSPGGCADILALTYFVNSICETKFQ